MCASANTQVLDTISVATPVYFVPISVADRRPKVANEQPRNSAVGKQASSGR